MDNQHNRLKALRQMERNLERAWKEAAWREDWIEGARLKKEYSVIFNELVALCRQLKII